MDADISDTNVSEAKFSQTFKDYDINGDGFVSREEYQKISKASVDQVDKIYTENDDNGDGLFIQAELDAALTISTDD